MEFLEEYPDFKPIFAPFARRDGGCGRHDDGCECLLQYLILHVG